jgi:4-hydroxy-tetrahydrodipicolinate synthase
VAGRVPVLVGVTDTSFVESVNLAGHAADAGAQAVVLSAPYYFPAGQPELLEYIERITPELPLPLFLYNMPSLTKVTFAPETVRRAMDLERIIGIKDSSGDMVYFHTIRQLAACRNDWTLLMGPEALLAESVLAGGQGGVNGGANLAPRLLVSIYEAARDRDMVRVTALQEQVLELRRLYEVGRFGSSLIKGIKCALSCLGICSDVMAAPFERFHEPERREVQEILIQLREKGVIPS